jgi:hypothetical protein
MKNPPTAIALPKGSKNHLDAKCPNCGSHILSNEIAGAGQVVCSSCEWAAQFVGLDSDQKAEAETRALFYMNLDCDPLLASIFFPEETNQKPEARKRDWERRVIKDADLPVDISRIPKDQREKHAHSSVTIPEEIQNYLDIASYPLTTDEVHMLEIKMEEYHDVQEPAWISIEPALRLTGKTWQFLPDVAKYETGFTYYEERK